MNRHFSPKFWHYGYENEEELHLFVHGCIYRGVMVYGVFFGYGDRRNEGGEVYGQRSTERSELGAVTRALEIIRGDPRRVHVHTANLRVIANLDRWIPFWKTQGFDQRLEEHGPQLDLVEHFVKLFEDRQYEAVFEYILNPELVEGCSLALNMAIDGYDAATITFPEVKEPDETQDWTTYHGCDSLLSILDA